MSKHIFKVKNIILSLSLCLHGQNMFVLAMAEFIIHFALVMTELFHGQISFCTHKSVCSWACNYVVDKFSWPGKLNCMLSLPARCYALCAF